MDTFHQYGRKASVDPYGRQQQRHQTQLSAPSHSQQQLPPFREVGTPDRDVV